MHGQDTTAGIIGNVCDSAMTDVRMRARARGLRGRAPYSEFGVHAQAERVKIDDSRVIIDEADEIAEVSLQIA